jgi:predicted DNA-binding protein (MmcQ/YjbR family)
MNIEAYRDYCLSKKATSESFPFDEKTLVFKVAGKMFALTDVDTFEFINLKCDPEYAVELRERLDGVKPGYHMNKTLWNSVYTNSDVDDQLMFELIDHSYDLVVKSLTKKKRDELSL